MTKDRRYLTVKRLIEAGYIKAFREIFDDLPKSIMAEDLGMNNTRFTRLMEKVDDFTMKELFRAAELIEISREKMLDLALAQYLKDKNRDQLRDQKT